MTRATQVVGWLKRRWYLPPFCAAMVIAVLVTWTWANNQAETRDRDQKAAVAGRPALLAQSQRIVECTTPGDPCYDQGQARTSQVLAGAFHEIDCDLRRAIAGLPAPDPSKGSCSTQTPASVYPGGAGP